MSQYTRIQISTDFSLWADFVDPNGTMTKDEFDALSIEQKLRLQDEAFGPEEKNSTDALSG